MELITYECITYEESTEIDAVFRKIAEMRDGRILVLQGRGVDTLSTL